MYDEQIRLISTVTTTDGYGDLTSDITEKTVFAEIKSIGSSEFYQAQAAGMKPEIKFKIADYRDYAGEKILKYAECEKEEDYSVIRTFRGKGRELEIICKRGID